MTKRELAKILREEANTWSHGGHGEMVRLFADGLAERLEKSADYQGEPALPRPAEDEEGDCL
jgi:hypothetical protein